MALVADTGRNNSGPFGTYFPPAQMDLVVVSLKSIDKF